MCLAGLPLFPIAFPVIFRDAADLGWLLFALLLSSRRLGGASGVFVYPAVALSACDLLELRSANFASMIKNQLYSLFKQPFIQQHSYGALLSCVFSLHSFPFVYMLRTPNTCSLDCCEHVTVLFVLL